MRILKTCPHCEGRGYISRFENNENECRAWSEKCVVCEGTGSILFHETNADHIRAMSDEELAKLLLDGCRGSKCDSQTQNEYGSVNCFECRMTWLQQPAKEDT